MKPEIAQQTAANIERYLQEHNLFYGLEPRPNGDASWTIALHNHPVSPDQARILSDDLPNAMVVFHSGSSRLMADAIRPSTRSANPHLAHFYRHLSVDVPETTRQLWELAVEAGATQVFSTRPDVVIDKTGALRVIEYNSDGGADKGNTQGVNDYSKRFLNQPTLGDDLALSFVREIRARFPQDQVTVATILPDNYRQEYDAQNIYFAKTAAIHGADIGINWITTKVSDVKIGDSHVWVHKDGQSYKLDLIDREFKLPGFITDYDFTAEEALVRASLEGRSTMLGTILPTADKIHLATIFDPSYQKYFLDSALKTFHSETALLDPNRHKLNMGDQSFDIDEISALKPDFGLVLKRGGDVIGSTGSKGIIISTDVSDDYWKRSIETALSEVCAGANSWVIQRFYEGARFDVEHLRNSRSKPKQLSAINRFAPYYVRSGDSFTLGGVLVTAGTDEETIKKNRNNVHGLRQNSYQAASVS